MRQSGYDRPSPILVALLIIPLALLTAYFIKGILNERRMQRMATMELSPEVMRYKAPDFDLLDIDGTPVSLKDYAGKPLLLNFWQTTCAPCENEMPALQSFIETQSDVAVLAISFEETPDDVRAFFDRIGVEGVRVAMDPDSEVRKSYSVYNIPVTFGIDAEGMVRMLQVGEMSLDEMENFADRLLAVEYPSQVMGSVVYLNG